MQIKESILTIAQSEKNTFDHAASVKFIHSFGLKCDCVGWTKIVLDNEEKWELVKRMGEEAKKQKMRLRCCYEREIRDVESEWYFIKPSFYLNNSHYDYDEVSTYYAIKGYKIPKNINLLTVGSSIVISEKFLNICKEEKFTGVDFAWINDTGRYKAPPFFYAFSNVFLSNPTTAGQLLDRNNKFTRRQNIPCCKQIDEMGGNLTLINEIFYSLEFTEVPIMLDRNNMPDTDFACVSGDGLSDMLLVGKAAADKLIEKGMIKEKELLPAVYYDKTKHNLLITHFLPEQFLTQYYIDKLEEEYKKFLKKKKPEYVPTEKATLTLLRKAKRENSDRFPKALKKSIVEELSETRLMVMAPYYAISNGGELSDEVEIYGYEEIGQATEEFLKELCEEETFLESMPHFKNPIVIGGTANGDTILLSNEGHVIRYDHEDPYLSQEWKTVFEFFYDNLEM